uniref:Trehalase n=1 Tax=Aureoumbra lagunensis TaxID=44058 RepID=A0A7S3NM94_9STRA|mmetsp:Transcript_11475/g.15677  ORF Transcript_11475/g.15677 Transcript_11475/m.15677 type:complete len:676 (-) Transcript_11475:38-2065(-)
MRSTTNETQWLRRTLLLVFEIFGITTSVKVAAMVYNYVSEDTESSSKMLENRIEERATAVERSSKVYCQGPLLEAVQSLGLFNDSKTFVDMRMRSSPEEILNKFSELESPLDYEKVNSFVHEYFFDADGELENWTPTDWTPLPFRISHIDDIDTRRWAIDLNERWKELGRRVADKRNLTEARSSLLAPPYPFIAPGGRFREPYYWDSFWIVKGLLASDMHQTAKNIISNLLEYIANFGFVPNGGRVYYLNRSQPPLLSEMLIAYLDSLFSHKQNTQQNNFAHIEFIRRALYLLETEYSWWMHSEHAVSLSDGYVLNRYYANTSNPRPESWREDVTTAASVQDKAMLYANIAAAAESGWDFSTRWMADGKHLDSTCTNNIIPVDLNAIMLRFEYNLALLHSLLLRYQTTNSLSSAWSTLHSFRYDSESELNNNENYSDDIDFANKEHRDSVRRYINAAQKRRAAIQALLWKPELSCWRDLWLTNNCNSAAYYQSFQPYASDFIMLWAGGADGLDIAIQASILKTILTLYKRGGFTTSLNGSGQQWDLPNAWPPLQYFLIRGLDRLDLPAAKQLATDATYTWLQSNYLGWNTSGVMMEKYNALEPGVSGQGGEYKPEIGFGWTNGVVLDLIINPPSLAKGAELSTSITPSSEENDSLTLSAGDISHDGQEEVSSNSS